MRKGKALIRAFNVLNDCDSAKKMNNIGLPTLALLDDAWNTLWDVYLYNKSTTVMLEVAQFFKKHGFKVVYCDIGWVIRA